MRQEGVVEVRVISPSFAQDILGCQGVGPDAVLRPIAFTVTEEVPEGTLVHNVMTGELILLDGSEDGGELSEYLARNWFLVPEDHDDRRLALELREVARLLLARAVAARTYTILTTTECNARCPYCYERSYRRETMDRQTASAVADLIEREAGGGKVRLRWFGGEPLCNTEPIDLVSERLSAAGIDFSSDMVTNGLLLDAEAVRKAAGPWRIRRAQITLDGTEGAYNRCKSYVNAEGSPFRRVLGNIDSLLDAGIEVRIRLNLGEDNADDLLELARILGGRFGGRGGCSAYVARLFDLASEGVEERFWALRAALREAGVLEEPRLDTRPRTHQCMADSDACLVVSPLGELGKCEHFYDFEPCGTVGVGIADAGAVARWKELEGERGACAACALYPRCVRLRGCPGRTRPCDEAEQTQALRLLREAMVGELRRAAADNDG